MPGRIGARAAIALLWLLHWLPLPLLAALGQVLGRLLWWLARSRRHVALPSAPSARRVRANSH